MNDLVVLGQNHQWFIWRSWSPILPSHTSAWQENVQSQPCLTDRHFWNEYGELVQPYMRKTTMKYLLLSLCSTEKGQHESFPANHTCNILLHEHTDHLNTVYSVAQFNTYYVDISLLSPTAYSSCTPTLCTKVITAKTPHIIWIILSHKHRELNSRASDKWLNLLKYWYKNISICLMAQITETRDDMSYKTKRQNLYKLIVDTRDTYRTGYDVHISKDL